jgi:S-formylglutathione hydrolase
MRTRTIAESVRKAEAVRTAEDFAKADFPTQGVIARSAAWSANPKAPPYFDMPFKSGKPQPLVMAEWNANMPVAMLGQYAANLKRLRSLALDIGSQDRVLIIAGNQLFDRLLTDFSISHSFEIYEGTHTSRIAERLETKVLPYFTRTLSFERQKSRR